MNSNYFSDSVKLEARRLADFWCCYCHQRAGDHLHHLIPMEEGGASGIDNAMLLCAQCHSDYGSRIDKRPQLRQARDNWYEIVQRRQRPEIGPLLERVQELATKQDLVQMGAELQGVFTNFLASFANGSTSPQQAANVASIMVTSTSASVLMSASPSLAVEGEVIRQCAKCRRPFEPEGVEVFCPHCADEN
jgi:HNH endonuclease